MPTLIHIPKCASTNDEILSYLSKDHPKIFGLYTLHQTRGKGQYGNVWEINPKENLAFTVAVQESFSTSELNINFCTANLIRRFIADLTGNQPQVKWPNDIILYEKKICGILIEKKNIQGQNYFIIGVGINILQTNFSKFPKAGSLFTQTGTSYNPVDIAESLFTLFCEDITFNKPIEDVIDEFNQYLFRKNQISVFQKKGFRQNGIIRNMDKNGFLWIDLENEGLQKFFHKEIELLY